MSARPGCGIIIVAGFLVASLWAPTGRGATWYVAPTGSESASGSNSWNEAVQSISNAVGKASNGDLVLVTNGTYVLIAQIQVTKGVTIRSFNNGVIDRTNTIVNGNYPIATNRCFYLSHSNAVVDGFTITNGWIGWAPAEYAGAGARLDNGGTLTNCIITGNVATNEYYGGGVWINTRGTISDCAIRNNRGTGACKGGGIFVTAAAAGPSTVNNCTISENTITGGGRGAGICSQGNTIVISNTVINNNPVLGNEYGGGLELYAGTMYDCVVSSNSAYAFAGVSCGGSLGPVYLINCRIFGNTARGSPGVAGCRAPTNGMLENCFIYNNSSAGIAGGVSLSGVLRNCLIMNNYANSSSGGGGVVAYNGARIDSCTIVSNRAAGTTGHGLYFINTNNIYVTNTIIYSNYASGTAASDVYDPGGTNAAGLSYCCVSVTNGFTGSGNMTNNPLFVNPVTDDYRLRVGSPCMNAGINLPWMTGAKDLDGNNRIDGFHHRVDMGAYEYLSSGTLFLCQ